MTDWNLWLSRYDKPRSPHSQRLKTVQRLIGRRIDRTAPHPISALSICAGDGRDILEVLGARADASRVKTTLVELDPRLCALARARVSENGIIGVDIKQADAGTTDAYAGVSPADIVILVGVFGNIADADVRATVKVLPALCKPGALIIWSLRQRPRRDQGRCGPHRHQAEWQHPNDYERVRKVREWLDAEGFYEVLKSASDAVFHVGAHRCVGEPPPLPASHRFFTFDLPPDRSVSTA
jgi:Methyltransferase domain